MCVFYKGKTFILGLSEIITQITEKSLSTPSKALVTNYLCKYYLWPFFYISLLDLKLCVGTSSLKNSLIYVRPASVLFTENKRYFLLERGWYNPWKIYQYPSPKKNYDYINSCIYTQMRTRFYIKLLIVCTNIEN